MKEEYKDIGDIKDKLVEEIGELLQAWGKYYRFGRMSYHPEDPLKIPNYQNLFDEIYDVEQRLKEFKVAIWMENQFAIMDKEWMADFDKNFIEDVNKHFNNEN